MRKFLFALLLLASPHAFATDMWRTELADGSITFSDRPLDDSSELIATDVGGTTLSRSAGATSSNPSSVQAAVNTPGATVADSTDQAQRTAQMAENCTQARESLNSLTTPDRVYVVDNDGTRRFLSDEERSQARNLAESQVETWCSDS